MDFRVAVALVFLVVLLYFVLSSLGFVSLQSKEERINNKIKDYQEDIAEINQKISELQEQLNEIQNSKFR